MRIDNSRAKAWMNCPLEYWERYEQNIQPTYREGRSPYAFGSRCHELLQQRHEQLRGIAPAPFAPLLDSPELEAEAQETFALYQAHWGVEPFEMVAEEQFFEVPIASHTYIGEFDGIVRATKPCEYLSEADVGKLFLLETKTERRNSKSNTSLAWQQKSQVGLYIWAAEQVYQEPFAGIILNVITRQSPAGKEPPTFRREMLSRTEAQKREAVENIIWVADSIEAMRASGNWPADRNRCVNEMTNWKCDYLPLHEHSRRADDLVHILFQPAEEYLAL